MNGLEDADLQYFLSSYGLILSSFPEKGRGLVSTRDFSPGDIIISQDPYVCAPSTSCCDGCFSRGKLKMCTSCRMTQYCGSTCQKSQWKLHRLECQALIGLSEDRKKMLTPTVRLMARLLLKKKLQDDNTIPTTSDDNYDVLLALVSHMADIDENKLVLYAQMANLVKLVLPLMEINIKEVIENFSKMACNAHTICDSELMPLGTGIYPVISIINHSCLPNCVLVFEGRKAVLRAVKHITRGTEVSITYIETALTTTERKKLLKEQYFFDCTCHCCNTPHTVFLKGALEDNQDIILNGYRCKAKPCHGVLHHDSANNIYRCKVCGSTREKHSIDQINSKIKLLSERASRCVSSKDYLEAKDLYKNVEHLQLKIYNPLSICLMKTQEDIMKILIALNDWEGALIYCRLTIPIYQRVYPAIHPLVGLQYYTCGKLEWLLRQAGEALQSYTKAVDILRITHGTTTPFMRELLLKIEEANADARLLQRKTALLQ